MPAPDRGFRRLRAPHDLEGAVTISRGQHDPGPPDQLAWCVSVAGQRIKLSAVSGTKIKADVRASHPPFMPQLSSFGNPTSGVEH